MKHNDFAGREKEDKRKGLVISFILHMLIFLLFFLPLINNFPVQSDAGILISFGEPDLGMNETESESVSTSEHSPPSASNPPSLNSNTEKEMNVSASLNEETSVIKTSSKKVADRKVDLKTKSTSAKETERTEREAAEKVKAERESKEKAEREAREKAEFESKKKRFSDLLGGGKGDNGRKGEKGDPDKKELEGISKGSGRVGGGLSGRHIEYEPSFEDNSQKTGKITLSICVGKDGKVTNAVFTQKGSTSSDPYLIDLARRTARKYKFSGSEIESQCGTVTVDFRVQ